MALDADTREQLLEAVRRFVAERLRPLEAKVAEDDAIPEAILAEMRALGLYGLSIPEAYGGLGPSGRAHLRCPFRSGPCACRQPPG